MDFGFGAKVGNRADNQQAVDTSEEPEGRVERQLNSKGLTAKDFQTSLDRIVAFTHKSIDRADNLLEDNFQQFLDEFPKPKKHEEEGEGDEEEDQHVSAVESACVCVCGQNGRYLEFFAEHLFG